MITKYKQDNDDCRTSTKQQPPLLLWPLWSQWKPPPLRIPENDRWSQIVILILSSSIATLSHTHYHHFILLIIFIIIYNRWPSPRAWQQALPARRTLLFLLPSTAVLVSEEDKDIFTTLLRKWQNSKKNWLTSNFCCSGSIGRRSTFLKISQIQNVQSISAFVAAFN